MSYTLGNTSLANLSGVHSNLVRVVKLAITLTDQDFGVHEGLRTIATQRLYVEKGVSETMASKHIKQPDGFGHAVDNVPYIAGQLRWEWEPIYRIADAMQRAAIVEGVPLIWGGVWDRHLDILPHGVDGLREAVAGYVARRKAAGHKRVFIDGPHYQLA